MSTDSFQMNRLWLLIIPLFAIVGSYFYGYSAGKQYILTENMAAAIAELKIVRVTEKVIEKDLAAIDTSYQKGLEDGKKHNDDVLARINAGTLRLYDQNRALRETCAAGNSSVSDGASGGELSVEASRFLYELAAEADRNTEQLTACQNTLKAIQRGINGQNREDKKR